jgi:hypothetical protein
MSDNLQQQFDSPLFNYDVHFDIVCHSILISILILRDTPQSNVFDQDFRKYCIIGHDYSKTKFGLDGRSFVDALEKNLCGPIILLYRLVLWLKKIRLIYSTRLISIPGSATESNGMIFL